MAKYLASLRAGHVNKYRNVRTEIDGILFQSKKEAKRYTELTYAKASGELLFFLRQVPIRCVKEEIKYVVDFVEFWKDGSVKFVDTKGYKTAVYKLKKKLVEAEYPIKILEI